MNKERLFKRIAQVGSEPYQVRWAVNGDASEYILLDELIETTAYAAWHRATDPVLSRNLSAVERDALKRFHDRVDALYGKIPWNAPNVSIAEIVEENQAMREIRGAAQECLDSLGVSFASEDVMND